MKLSKEHIKVKAKELLSACLSRVIRVAAICAALGSLVLLAAKAPEIHGAWLRNKVGSKVYLITGKIGQGTGFAIAAPSGNSYILTNDHVCEVSEDGGLTVKVVDANGDSLPRRILERSQYTDLCLIEGFPGVQGLAVGADPDIGQVVAAVGHPSGYGITMSRGEIIEQRNVVIQAGIISMMIKDNTYTPIPEEDGGVPESQCKKPKNKIVEALVPMAFWLVPAKICLVVTKDAYNTNVLIQPGSSGSPLVNFYGRVIGVVFASDRAGWGSAVSHADLVNFLKLY